MSFMLTNAVSITVGGTTYNSLTDFGLAIENTDYLGTPVQGTDNLAFVPGSNRVLDFTDEIFGEQYFSYRTISINFGGIESPEEWDAKVSAFRNIFEGKTVQLVFANDPDWYWTGRASIEDFEHNRYLGTFTFRIDYADPYKYRQRTYTVSSPASGSAVSVTVTRMPVIPTVTSSGGVDIVYGGKSYHYTGASTYLNPDLVLRQGTHSLMVYGNNSVTISYLDGSL